ncbi:hypothetical protein GTA08_BOTSDO07713 [Neofusicoccum parvum]|nr:hypothetical protein GTA08_BOTSDO07713 [Neofusicoccum parvum]
MNAYSHSLIGDVDFVAPLSSFQSLVFKSALFLSLHILLFILLVPQQEKKNQRPHWSERKHLSAPSLPSKPAAAGKHERKDSLMS